MRLLISTLRLRRGLRWLWPLAVLVLAGCGFPRKDYTLLPDAGVIRVVQGEDGPRAVAPDCAPLYQASPMNKFDDPRPAIAFGCATYTNLAGQVAHPQDLARPADWGGPQADTAASAVQRYHEGAVTPLRQTRTTNVGKN